MATTAEVEDAWEAYRTALERLAEVDDGSGVVEAPREQNRLVDVLTSNLVRLQASETGRTAISGLLDDPRPVVRLWAAAHALHRTRK